MNESKIEKLDRLKARSNGVACTPKSSRMIAAQLRTKKLATKRKSAVLAQGVKCSIKNDLSKITT